MPLQRNANSAKLRKKPTQPALKSAVSRKIPQSSSIHQLQRAYQPAAAASGSLRAGKASSNTNATKVNEKSLIAEHIAFFPLLVLVFVIWCIYRYLFRFPIWFDETVGKAVFFGLPVMLYASLTRSRSMTDTVHPKYMQSGLWMGLAVGGIFGFAGAIASLLRKGVVVQAAPLFIADAFWLEFALALATGFWESLFFFSWIMIVVMERFKRWPVLNQALLTAAIFLAFHLPNTLLRFSFSAVSGQLVLLFFFALGQALMFYRVRNIYALALSHAIWGMVLLVHTR